MNAFLERNVRDGLERLLAPPVVVVVWLSFMFVVIVICVDLTVIVTVNSFVYISCVFL